MKNLEFEYKGELWKGTCKLSEIDGVWYGRILGIPGLVSYESETLSNIEEEFKLAVIEYVNCWRCE